MLGVDLRSGNSANRPDNAADSDVIANSPTVTGNIDSDDSGRISYVYAVIRSWRCELPSISQGSNVVKLTAKLKIDLLAGAECEQVIHPVRKIVEHGPTRANILLVRGFSPTANLLRVSRKEPDLVRLNPTTLVGVISLVSIYSGLELELY